MHKKVILFIVVGLVIIAGLHYFDIKKDRELKTVLDELQVIVAEEYAVQIKLLSDTPADKIDSICKVNEELFKRKEEILFVVFGAKRKEIYSANDLYHESYDGPYDGSYLYKEDDSKEEDVYNYRFYRESDGEKVKIVFRKSFLLKEHGLENFFTKYSW